MPISEELLEILVCPQCHGDLTYDRTAEKLTCSACRLRYPIVDDVPVMLIEEAERIAENGVKHVSGKIHVRHDIAKKDMLDAKVQRMNHIRRMSA